MAIVTTISGNDLQATYGIIINASRGVTDHLTRKPTIFRNWADYHGEQVNLSKPVYEPRNITFQCTLLATSETDFLTKLNNFKALFQVAGTQRLTIAVGSNPILYYEVYNMDGIVIDKKWRIGRAMYGSFELNLREPEPVKRVISFNGTGNKTINISTDYPLNIYWGDGSSSKSVRTDITHNYSTSGDHFVIITGMIDEITSMTYTTGTLIWSKLQ
jgi:hypothetical protein